MRSADARALGHRRDLRDGAPPQGVRDSGGHGRRLGRGRRRRLQRRRRRDPVRTRRLEPLLLLRRLGGGRHAAGDEARVVHRHHRVVERRPVRQASEF